MHIRIINGPNLDLLGTREPSIYGSCTFADLLQELQKEFSGNTIDLYQSNVEGELINALHAADKECDGVVLNPAGYTHTSVSLRDALATLKIPVVEVHVSNIHAREEFRHRSLTAVHCVGVITGFGTAGYRMAVDHLLRRLG